MPMSKRETFSKRLLEAAAADPLAVVRAPTESHFSPDRISPSAVEALREASKALRESPKKNVRAALEAVLMLDDPTDGLEWWCRVGVLETLLPELYATVQFSQEDERRHKDVWAHTKQVVTQTPARLPVRWAALLHDIGKVETRTYTPDGRVQFLGHAEKGAALFRKLSRRLGFPRHLGGRVHFLILKHLRANQYSKDWNDSAVRRFYRQVGDHLDDLLDLSRGDITTKNPRRKERALDNLQELTQRIRYLQQEEARKPLLPPGIGHHLMRHFNLQPGRAVGELRGLLERQIHAGEIEPRLPPEAYLSYMEEHPELLTAEDPDKKPPQQGAGEETKEGKCDHGA